MSGGPPRTEDKVNTASIVMIGICSAILVYVSIAALQAFYANDVADVQTMADYGGQDKPASDLRATQEGNISTVGATGKTDKGPTYQIKIGDAIAYTLLQAKTDPSNLVPMVGTQTTPTILPVFGRPKMIPVAPAPPPVQMDGAGSGSGSGSTATGSGSGSGTH